MTAIERIAAADQPALEAWARLIGEPIELAAESFEDEYLGEWPTLKQFARDRVQWEYGVPDFLLPFFNDIAFCEEAMGEHGWFVSIGHEGGVWIFQFSPPPSDWFVQ